MQQAKNGEAPVATVLKLTTVNGESVEGLVEVEVSPAVAAVLAEPERAMNHRERTYTDMSGRSKSAPAFDPDDHPDSTRRQNNRPMPKGGIWEGPRLHFNLLLGLSRADWHGERALDEFGRCDLCHDAKLGPGVYCLGCDASGREAEIEKPPKSLTAKLTATLFRDDGLKGGKGSSKPRKPATKKAKKAAKKAAKKGKRRG